MSEILVLYYSRNGSVKQMAQLIARGIEMVPDMHARIRTVPSVSANTEASEPKVPSSGAPFVEEKDLRDCVGLVLGSPTRFGNMATPIKYFLDQLGGIWTQGVLEGKPASVFTSASSLHGGQETTLISMMLPLMHLGMVITGVPYSTPELSSTQSGGTPYGASHYAGPTGDNSITEEEKNICISQGKNLAKIAKKLAN